MLPTQDGAIRLFRFSGIQVYLHWSWFVVALIEFNLRGSLYSSPFWNIAEYIALFAIVLMHEFGHALACRQTGGKADQIVLWPLGGVAYVAPPPRPGATLWAIAAGPLVNLVLLPLALVVAFAGDSIGWEDTQPNLQHFLWTLVQINAGLLIFNLLPVYPLDGGQILRSLLWFVVGRAKSLFIATAVGLVGALTLGGIAIYAGSLWIGILAIFMGINCWRALQHSRVLRQVEQAPVYQGARCPNCQEPPLVGAFWLCNVCQTRFDTFATGAQCPNCHQRFPITTCIQCGASNPMSDWLGQQAPPIIRQ